MSRTISLTTAVVFSVAIFNVLLQLGCESSAGGVNIWSAAADGDISGIEQFARAGGDLNVTSFGGVTPLLKSFNDEKLESFEALLKNGADPNTIANDGRSVMVLAPARKNSRWLRLALDHGGDPNLFVKRATTGRRGPPLHTAIGSHSRDNIHLLLDRGADVNYRRIDWPARGTALISAVYSGLFDIILVFLERGADWTVSLDGNSFLGALKNCDNVTYRLKSDRDALRAVKEWLKRNGCKDVGGEVLEPD